MRVAGMLYPDNLLLYCFKTHFSFYFNTLHTIPVSCQDTDYCTLTTITSAKPENCTYIMDYAFNI
jgi:hypothetical protein